MLAQVEAVYIRDVRGLFHRKVGKEQGCLCLTACGRRIPAWEIQTRPWRALICPTCRRLEKEGK